MDDQTSDSVTQTIQKQTGTHDISSSDRALEIRTESSESLFCSIISCSLDKTGKPSVGVLTELTFWPDISSHQIVLPRPYRNNVLSMAHETALSGHLGVNKTYYKILEHFY
jgi:hypothetical protein